MAKKNDSKVVKFRLVLNVDYIPNGTDPRLLQGMLLMLADRAAGAGLFTGETSAEVDRWSAKASKRRV